MMRRPSIIAYFPCFGVALLGGALVTFTHAAPAAAAPKPAGAKATPVQSTAQDTAAAPAGPDAKTKQEARAAYSAGEKAYNQGDYSAAYLEFKKAYELIPTIHAQYWMAMCQSQGPEKSEAFDGLTAVLASPDKDKLGQEKVSAATARLEELKKMPATVAITSMPAGAEVSVDGTAQPGVTPTTISLTPGTHKVAVAARGYEPFEAEVVAKPGQRLEQNAELKKLPELALPPPEPAPKPETPAPAPAPKKAEKNLLPAYITLGAAVVGAGVGTAFGVQALSAKSDFDKHPTNGNADKAERDALIADMAFGVALTLGVTGIVLLTTAGDSADESTAHSTSAPHPLRARLEVAPVVTGTTQGAAARLTF
jgi:tetratricopeptide (TPR) repeat protein